MAETPARDDKGRILPGSTGNPGGRPSLPVEFKEHGLDALEKLIEFMDDKDHRIALRATEVVVERIYGKPAQPLEHDGAGDMLDAVAERISQRMNGNSGSGASS